MTYAHVIVAAALGSGAFGCVSTARPCAPVSIEGAQPLTIRAEAGEVWASAHAWTEPRHVWALPAHGDVGNLSTQALPDDVGWVVTFQQGGVAWRGELDASRAARTPLQIAPVRFDGGDSEVGAVRR
jgi:hypothetical protein